MENTGSVSILTDIKDCLDGIPEEDKNFDLTLMLHINSAFARLNQLGIGPEEGFTINDNTAIWDDFETDKVIQGLSKQFVLCSVKIGFDPPTSSFVLSSLQETRKELAFSLIVEHDRQVANDGV